ncbi:glycosyltransferase family 2 protein [Bacillus horti]|uniref:Glucosyl-3-phosphoglycerate synthase n=1 Tax=Caldalkalibacillus horti TaxID=77523 RepID=A0ABT9W1Y4_9BACI|nr:glycosyltransferase family 2 protein [Bacillus horti]MDQ0166860.1 glycosyltransferase involved in cell wall biosynthesis [Bacillus horti]
MILPVSVVIPAYNEEKRIGQTLAALTQEQLFKEIIVVDDGSTDQTYNIAKNWTKHVLKFSQNQGKTEAIRRGSLFARQPILLFLDADLEESAAWASELVQPILHNEADMVIAALPAAKKGGFGLIKRMARAGIHRKTGKTFLAPLSGQRAIKRNVFFSCFKGSYRFGLEVGLTIDCLNQGFVVQEMELPFTHRELGRGPIGFLHRFKQGLAVYQTLRSRRRTWRV